MKRGLWQRLGLGAKLCVFAILAYLAVAVFGEVQYRIAKYRDVTPAYNVVRENARYLPPLSSRPEGGVFLLGSDNLGRDVALRVVQGARIAFHVGVMTSLIAILLLYRAFGWEDTMPQFAHLPLLLKPEGNGKLSKRDGDRLGFPVFPLEWHDPKSGEISSGYREKGYLPEAVINFLALLGWNPGNDQEIMSMDELIKLFDLSRCSKAGAKFDYKKGIWFNHEYILQKSDEEIAHLFVPVLKEHGIEAPFDKVQTIVGLMKNRVNFVSELWDVASFFFVAPETYDEKTVRKRWKEYSAQQMTELMEVLRGIEDFSIEGQEPVVMNWIAEKGYGTGDVMNAFRLTLVGEGKGPHMFEITSVLGKEETLRRMQRAIDVLK